MSKKLKFTDKFVKELGHVADFVEHLKTLELDKRIDIATQLSDFGGTRTGKRYLLISISDSIAVVDFRHFFAAMSFDALGGSISGIRKGNSPILMLGIANELVQCLEEIPKWKINSCFSPEDLLSNRLGAEFAEILNVKKSEHNKNAKSDLLLAFLYNLHPVPPDKVLKLQLSYSSNFKEVVRQVFSSFFQVLIPKVY
jgi:hypothetical protein